MNLFLSSRLDLPSMLKLQCSPAAGILHSLSLYTQICTPILCLCQGMLVGKVLTKADVEHCRIVLPRMAMEANLPEVVEANVLHVVSTLFTALCDNCGVCIVVFCLIPGGQLDRVLCIGIFCCAIPAVFYDRTDCMLGTVHMCMWVEACSRAWLLLRNLSVY